MNNLSTHGIVAIVRNVTGKFLLLEDARDQMRGHWAPPHGRCEDSDITEENGVIREVKEECGLKSVVIEKPLIKTFHTYTEKNKSILKKTHWYSMYAEGDQILIPQTEEDIEKAKWMTKEKILDKVYSNTYLAVKEVLNANFKLIG